jgi:uncharacterized protein YkwD
MGRSFRECNGWIGLRRRHGVAILVCTLWGCALIFLVGGAHADAPPATFEEQVVELTNIERAATGLPPLKQAALLEGVAEAHSQRMAEGDFVMHCDPESKLLPWERMTRSGYIWNWAGENLAAGYSTPAAVMTGWMGSAGHRANILSPNVVEIGVGYYYQADDAPTVRQDANGDCTPDIFGTGPFRRYWTQDLGRRSQVWPVVIEREAHQTASLIVDLFVYTPTVPSQMRFSNDAATGGGWIGFANDAPWRLSAGNGVKTVYAEVKNGASSYVVSDTIWLQAPPPLAPVVSISGNVVVYLAWPHEDVNLWYNVYRSGATPYFAIGDVGVTLIGSELAPPVGGEMIFQDDPTASGAFFYLVEAVAGDGETAAESNCIGWFRFDLSSE